MITSFTSSFFSASYRLRRNSVALSPPRRERAPIAALRSSMLSELRADPLLAQLTVRLNFPIGFDPQVWGVETSLSAEEAPLRTPVARERVTSL